VAGGSYLIDYSAIKKYIFSRLYLPVAWPGVALDIHNLMTKNQTALVDLGRAISGQYGIPRNEAQVAIRCADKRASLRFSSLEEARPAMEALYQTSRLASDIFTSVLLRCAQWRMPAKEHPGYLYHLRDGVAKVKMRRPMLLIGNTWDPVTPIDGSFNMSSSFEGSVVLRHDGYGVSFFFFFSRTTGPGRQKKKRKESKKNRLKIRLV